MADDLATDSSTSSETSDVELLEEGSDSKEVSNLEEAEETPEKEEKEDEESEEDQKESDEEEDEVEEEEEEDQEDEEEVSEEEKQITRPSWKQLKKDYPGIEKNEELRQVYFREKAFSEVFPTVPDARIAADKANTLDYFDESLRDGDPTVLFQALASSSEGTIVSLAEKILPSLHNLSPQLFARATKDFLSDVLNDIHDFSLKKEDKNLTQSVKNICKYLYGDYNVPSRPGRADKDPEILRERQRLQAEKAEIFNSQKSAFVGSVDKSIDRQLSQILSEGLDTGGNEFLKRAIVRDTLDEMKALLRTDENFKSNFGRLLSQAARAGFTSEWKTRIISAYLGRARGLALAARSRIKAEAIGKRQSNEQRSTKRVEGAEKEDKGSNRSGGKSSNKRDFYRTHSDEDIILGKA